MKSSQQVNLLYYTVRQHTCFYEYLHNLAYFSSSSAFYSIFFFLGVENIFIVTSLCFYFPQISAVYQKLFLIWLSQVVKSPLMFEV